jgi:hypothetical protein
MDEIDIHLSVKMREVPAISKLSYTGGHEPTRVRLTCTTLVDVSFINVFQPKIIVVLAPTISRANNYSQDPVLLIWIWTSIQTSHFTDDCILKG